MTETLKKIPDWARMLALVLVLATAGTALASVVNTGYNSSRGEQGTEGGGYNVLWDGTVSSVSSTSWAQPQLPVYTRGNPKVGLKLSTTDEDENIVVTAGLYHYNEEAETYTFLGISKVVTVEPDAHEVSAGRYVDDTVHEFDTFGANVIDVRLTTLPGPDMNIEGGVYGYGVEFYLPDAPAPP